MKYIVTVNGERHLVEREDDRVALEGLTTTAALEQVGDTPVRLVTIGTEVHRVIVRQRTGKGA